MKRIKKIIALVAIVVCFCVTLTACTSSMSYTFAIETGDKVKITLDTSDGLSLHQNDGQFIVQNGEEVILAGMFMSIENYEYYEQAVLELAEVIESDEGFYFYRVESGEDVENDFIYRIHNSNTAVLIGSQCDQDIAKAAFDSLTFELV